MGEALKKARREAGLTQKQVAELIGLTRERISQLENDRSKDIGLSQMEAFARIYDVPVSRFTAVAEPQLLESILIPFFADGLLSASLSASLASEGEPVVAEEHIPVSVRWIDPAHRHVAVPVRGNCLSPRVEDGDVAVIDMDATPREGDSVIVDIDGVANVKEFKRRRFVGARQREVWILGCNEGDITVQPFQVRGVVAKFEKPGRRN